MKRVLPVAVLFAVLLALVVVKEMRRAGVDAGAGDAAEYVALAASKFDVKDVAKIEVTAPGGAEPAFVIERVGEGDGEGDGARWLQTKPFRAPAHVNHVETLCRALAAGDAELRADDAGALGDVDLTPERAVAVRVTAGDGKALAHVGVGRSTGSSGAFVRLLSQPGDVRTLETTADLRGALGLGRSSVGGGEPDAPKATHFRDRDFPTVKLDKPKRLEVTAPGRRVVLEKDGADWKAVEGGPGLPVNQQGVQQLLERFGPEFRASDLADPADLAKFGLAEPKWTVAVTLEDGTVKRVFGGGDAATDRWYVRLDAKQDPDVVYEATSWEWQRLFPSGAGLFTFESVDLPEDRLTRIVVDRKGAERIEIVREGTKPSDDWKVVAPDWPLVPKQSSLRSLASLLRNVRAVDWIDGTDAGPEEIVVRAGLRETPDAELTTVRIGGKSLSGKDRLAVLPGHEGRVFVLADSTVDRIGVSAASLFEAKLLHGWSEPDVKAVRVTPAGGEAWAIERTDDGWSLVRGSGTAPADPVAVARWIVGLLALEMREASAADAPPEATVAIEKTDGTTRSLVLSAAKDGRRTVTFGTARTETDRADLLPDAASLAAPAKPEEK